MRVATTRRVQSLLVTVFFLITFSKSPAQVKNQKLFIMRSKKSCNNKLMCKKCGLVVRSDDPITKGDNNDQGGGKAAEGTTLPEDEEEEEENIQEFEASFNWSNIEFDESKPRPMPPVCDDHRLKIERLKSDGVITDRKVYEVMLSLDFNIFYDNVTDEWMEHCYVLLERSNEVVKEGDHVLVFPYNTYYSVALSLMLGPKGAVMCYGHLQNSHTLKKNGLDWLMSDHRLKFRNENDALYYSVPLQTFQETGWVRMAPFNVIMMSDNDLTDVVRDQVSEEGVVFRPDNGDYLYRNHAGM